MYFQKKNPITVHNKARLSLKQAINIIYHALRLIFQPREMILFCKSRCRAIISAIRKQAL